MCFFNNKLSQGRMTQKSCIIKIVDKIETPTQSPNIR